VVLTNSRTRCRNIGTLRNASDYILKLPQGHAAITALADRCRGRRYHSCGRSWPPAPCPRRDAAADEPRQGARILRSQRDALGQAEAEAGRVKDWWRTIQEGRMRRHYCPQRKTRLESSWRRDYGCSGDYYMRTILIFVATSFVLLMMPQASFSVFHKRASVLSPVEQPAIQRRLTCVCKKADGREQVTGINVLSCPSERLSNINGNLACGP
jgi:hypothetical protein